MKTPCFSRGLLSVLVVGFLVSPSSRADEPMPPAHAAVESCSLNGRFCLGRAEGGDMLRLYAVEGPGKKKRLRWEVRSAARVFMLSNDGEHWVEVFEGANLMPPDAPDTTVMLTFHRREETLTRLELRQLVQHPRQLPDTVSHKSWARTYGFDSRGRFILKTAESVDFLFDATTGQPIGRGLFQ